MRGENPFHQYGNSSLAEALNRQRGHNDANIPQPSPGVLTSHTTRGVFRKARPQKIPPPTQPGVIYTIAQGFDDFLLCSDPSGPYGNDPILIAKPPTLRCSAWKTDYNYPPGLAYPFPVFPYGVVPAGQPNQSWAYHYVNGGCRLKIMFNFGEYDNLLANGSNNPGDQLDYIVITEVIDPPYMQYVPSSANVAMFDTQMFSGIVADQMAMPILTLPVGTDTTPSNGTIWDAAMYPNFLATGTPVVWLDRNVDARRWTSLHQAVGTLVLMEKDDKTLAWVPYENPQNTDQIAGNKTPSWFTNLTP